jgi:conjugative transfer signal peptidase TraF
MEIMKRFLPLLSGVLLLTMMIGISLLQKEKRLIYNYTDSLPHGFYLIEKKAVRKGILIVFLPPENITRMMTERGYLKEGGYLMKYIAAEPGDTVSTRGRRLKINGEDFGMILKHDKEGRSLPIFRFTGILNDGYLFAIKGKNNSFDSRYFGPISKHSVIGVARPIWLFTTMKDNP